MNAASSGLASLSSIKSNDSPSSSASTSTGPKNGGDASTPKTLASYAVPNHTQVTEAVEEEQMQGHPASQPTSSHVDSALDDAESTDDEADVEGILRTGNERFRRGSRHLSRLSSTLGEGITAHWKKSGPSPLKTDSTGSTSASWKAILPATDDVNAQNAKSGQQDSSGASLPPSAGLPDVHAESKRSAPAAAAEILSPIEQAKRLAAYRAVDVHVKPHHRVIGIGSGSTVPYVVDRLLEQGEEANKKRWVSSLFPKVHQLHWV